MRASYSVASLPKLIILLPLSVPTSFVAAIPVYAPGILSVTSHVTLFSLFPFSLSLPYLPNLQLLYLYTLPFSALHYVTSLFHLMHLTQPFSLISFTFSLSFLSLLLLSSRAHFPPRSLLPTGNRSQYPN